MPSIPTTQGPNSNARIPPKNVRKGDTLIANNIDHSWEVRAIFPKGESLRLENNKTGKVIRVNFSFLNSVTVE